MAETAVGLVVDKLKSVLNQEESLFKDVHEEIRYIGNELDAMKSFLRDADVKMEMGQEEADGSFKGWVKQVRELAFCIEDVIDRWALHRAQQLDRCGFVRRLCRSVKRLKEHRDIAYEIQEIKKLVVAAKERCDRYRSSGKGDEGGQPNRGNVAARTWRVASLFIPDDELVGIECPKEDLVGSLVEGEIISVNKVISVVGMGGLGKTTLVKKVYDDQRVSMHFDCYAWITVSQSRQTDELLRSMIKQFQRKKEEAIITPVERIESLGEVSLINFLGELLAEKRYLVVFDDVWEIDFWDYMKLALPDNKRGSRIIFTTRKGYVAPSFKESPRCYLYKLEPLPHNKAFELFCKKTFHFEGGFCPQGLMQLSHAIVEKCGGLPLAVVTIAGLLATKDKTVAEWQKLYDGLGSVLTSDEKLASDQRVASLARVLSLSYHDLPCFLKVCFLYLGMFPEDYSINCWRLVRLWVAQGFIKERQGMTMDDVAEEYLFELINRSLIQVARIGVLGKPRECRVHDLLREIIILPKLEEFGVHQMSGGKGMNANGTCRHLAIHGCMRNVPPGLRISRLRSMVLFETGRLPDSLMCTFFENLKLLRVLDFQDPTLQYIPEEVGNLWHLRCLSLRYTSIKLLPKSIGKLSNLEILDVRNTDVSNLPVEINNFVKLRHLLAYSDDCFSEYNPNSRRGVNVRCRIGCLQALQQLSFIQANCGIELMSELGRLTQLRKLGIKNLKTEDGLALCNALERMPQLRILKIFSAKEEEYLELQSLSFPPPLLQCLYLSGPLVRLPDWIIALKDLVKINLRWSKLGEDALQILQALPNLELIWLYKAYEGKLLHFPKGSFGKIKVLGLRCLAGLSRLLIEEGAMPFLEELQLGPFPQMEELPSINFLKNLKTLKFYDLQKKFTTDMLPNGGHDYWKIEHIPSVLFSCKATGLQHDTYKLGDPDLLKRLDGACSGIEKQRSMQLG